MRNRDRMSVESMLLIAKPSVREVIRKVPALVQTVIPDHETFRLYEGNAKGSLRIQLASVSVATGIVLSLTTKSHCYS